MSSRDSILPNAGCATERRHIRVGGLVQGVGFRPFVYRLAHDLGLGGWVRNDGGGVDIEAQGPPVALDALAQRLRADAPGPARVERLDQRRVPTLPAAGGFEILGSAAGPVQTMIGPDSAVCPQCLSELFDPADRRWRYAFINCTACGPRYSLTAALPYDRSRTGMAGFELCDACRREYEGPLDRRFHAEPNACPACGPRLALLDRGGRALDVADPIAAALQRIGCGDIVAIKGLGGFHLACDARQPQAVERLRQRKDREQKPFALMVAGLASARRWVRLDPLQESWLQSPQRPIVLAPKRAHADARLGAVAPGLSLLGLMLPYTPLHYLLFHEDAGRPAGTGWLDHDQPLALVMSSANPGGEPLVTGNDEAVERLDGIADALLVHDRPIVARCDDSVVQAGKDSHGRAAIGFIRRARGFAPEPIEIAAGGPDVLAVGGHLKNTVCRTRGAYAYVSPHIGDLDSAAGCEALVQTAEHLGRLLQAPPDAIACDLHPDFFSTRHAAALAAAHAIACIPVQHHHAHVGAVMAEHRLEGPVLGLALDGLGLGSDGGVWGGELLEVDGARMTRLGHLLRLPQAGGDRAAREPWRMASSALHLLGRQDQIVARFSGQPAAPTVAQMLRRGINSAPTSSMGRWFDAAAALLGVRETAAFEGQAAMLLEALAAGADAGDVLAGGWSVGADLQLDLLPLAANLADEPDAARGARRFHATLAAALQEWVGQAARRTGLRRVVLAGGCFMNRILSDSLAPCLAERRFEVWTAQRLPPNDGGLCLGQAWVAQRALRSGETKTGGA
jgi:hydrogenase maturation protein HypF